MSWRVTVEELIADDTLVIAEPPTPILRFQQIVDVIDLPAVFAAINKPPRKVRVRKAKAEK